MAESSTRVRYSLRVKPKDREPGGQKLSNKTAKNYYKEYRIKLKQDETKYNDYKKADALKKRDFRKNLVGEKLDTYNEKAKLRMRAYRKRKREEGGKEKPATRHLKTKLREYWRQKKREQRLKITEEAKKKEREKRRERYKAVKRGFELQKEETRQNAQSNYIPKSAEKFAERIEKAVKSASPRKKSALLKTGLFASAKKNETNAKIVAQVKRRLKFLKRQRTKQGRSHYQLFTRSLVGKYVVEHELRKALDIKWEHWMRMSEIEKNGQEK